MYSHAWFGDIYSYSMCNLSYQYHKFCEEMDRIYDNSSMNDMESDPSSDEEETAHIVKDHTP